MFKLGTKLIHVKSGNVYHVLMTPDMCKLESDATPVYVYGKVLPSGNQEIWVRPQTEMEDGRFIVDSQVVLSQSPEDHL